MRLRQLQFGQCSVSAHPTILLSYSPQQSVFRNLFLARHQSVH